jgi:hypothetical protein
MEGNNKILMSVKYIILFFWPIFPIILLLRDIFGEKIQTGVVFIGFFIPGYAIWCLVGGITAIVILKKRLILLKVLIVLLNFSGAVFGSFIFLGVWSGNIPFHI